LICNPAYEARRAWKFIEQVRVGVQPAFFTGGRPFFIDIAVISQRGVRVSFEEAELLRERAEAFLRNAQRLLEEGEET